jgi:hypothetical protein
MEGNFDGFGNGDNGDDFNLNPMDLELDALLLENGQNWPEFPQAEPTSQEPEKEKDDDKDDNDTMEIEGETTEQGSLQPNPPAPVPKPPPTSRFLSVPQLDFVGSTPFSHKSEMLRELAAEFDQFTRELNPVERVHSSLDIAGIAKSLEDNGFAVVELPRFPQLISTLLTSFKNTLNAIRANPDFKQLFKFFNRNDSGQIMGFGTQDSPKTKRDFYLNIFPVQPIWRYIFNITLPLIRNLLMKATNDLYDDTFTWLTNFQPIFFHEGEPNTTYTRSSPIHCQPPAAPGADISEAFYLAPYLFEYFEATKSQTPNAHPAPLEHLQLFVPLTTTQTPNNDPASKVSSIRIVPGMHKIYDKLVSLILKHHDVSVDTGDFQGVHCSFANPNPKTSRYYRLSPEFSKMFESFVVDIPIHHPEGRETLIILDPRMGLSMKVISECVLLPLSIWPFKKVPNPAIMAELHTFREFEFTHSQTPVAPTSATDNRHYMYFRRAYIDHHEPKIHKKNHEKIMKVLRDTLEQSRAAFSAIERNYYVDGFPTDSVKDFSNPQIQQSLLIHFQKRKEAGIALANLAQFVTEISRGETTIALHPDARPCEMCTTITTIGYAISVQNPDLPAAESYDYICGECLCKFT